MLRRYEPPNVIRVESPEINAVLRRAAERADLQHITLTPGQTFASRGRVCVVPEGKRAIRVNTRNVGEIEALYAAVKDIQSEG